MKGVLLVSPIKPERLIFRVYVDPDREEGNEYDGVFTDYIVIHPDMNIEITDDDAFVKVNALGYKYIDVSNRSLGVDDDGN